MIGMVFLLSCLHIHQTGKVLVVIQLWSLLKYIGLVFQPNKSL